MSDTVSETIGLLADWVDNPQLAQEFSVNERTVVRWQDQPDGMPFAKVGRRRLSHIPTAREWLKARLRRPNPRRAQRRHKTESA
jgi:hypothetical protein